MYARKRFNGIYCRLTIAYNMLSSMYVYKVIVKWRFIG